MNLPFLSTGPKRPDISRDESNPFISLQREIDRVFSDFARGLPFFAGREGRFETPRMDIREKNGTIEMTAELPGLEEKDVEITVVDGILTLRGEKKSEREEKDENRYLMERSYGSFVRSIELPAGVDPEKITAAMTKGVLTITIPRPPEAQPSSKKVEVKSA